MNDTVQGADFCLSHTWGNFPSKRQRQSPPPCGRGSYHPIKKSGDFIAEFAMCRLQESKAALTRIFALEFSTVQLLPAAHSVRIWHPTVYKNSAFSNSPHQINTSATTTSALSKESWESKNVLTLKQSFCLCSIICECEVGLSGATLESTVKLLVKAALIRWHWHTSQGTVTMEWYSRVWRHTRQV